MLLPSEHTACTWTQGSCCTTCGGALTTRGRSSPSPGRAGAPPAQGGAAAAAPAGPSAPAPSETQASPEVRAPLPPGGVLGWFSEYARRLRTGWYQVSPLDPEHDWSLV